MGKLGGDGGEVKWEWEGERKGRVGRGQG